ncbi:MAG TPA: hypothetical protein VKV25_06455, partial [Acidimicrobiales bacterium]|nr:hypothetical protein [Acidimicrobiales bacterium]
MTASPGADLAPAKVRVAGTGGVSLAVRVRNPGGAATPMLLVHGLSSNARLWDGAVELLAGGDHPVAAVDQRG